MRRREFISLIGMAAAWPLPLQAQQRMRRVAVQMAMSDTDPDGRAWLDTFLQALRQLGWNDGQNVRIEIRWAGGDSKRAGIIAQEFVTLKPDVIVANGTPGMTAMKHATSTIPVVFVLVNEPVTQGFIASMARPGGNATGFTMFDFSMIGKQLDLLKTMAPALVRVGLMFNPEGYPHYDVYLRTLQADARRPVEVTRAAVRSPAEIDAELAALASLPGGGLVVLPDGGFTISNRATIRAALDRHGLPHVVPYRSHVSEGALMSYGPSQADIFRRSAEYVDRVLRGANPADLPSQNPTKFELAINLRTARTLGLTAPPSLLAVADEVIE